MKWKSFLKERVWNLILLFLVGITIEIFLLPYPIHPFIRTYIMVAIIGVAIISLAIEYQKKKHFYEHMLSCMEHLDQKYLVRELLTEADFIEGKITNEVLIEIEKSMLENVNRYKQINQEYEEYIELWIHEIKLPIATTKMMIENHPNELTKKMEEEMERIDQYVEQALYYARSSNVEKDYYIKKIQLKEPLHEVLTKNKKTILAKKIKIEMEEIEEVVYSDAKWLAFILDQIIRNSIQYTEKEPTIKVQARKEKECTILTIQDNGLGIPQKDMSRVFEKGFTGENGRIVHTSTGIGLYLTKRLCDKLGHGITIDSEEGNYTKVEIIFPKNSYTMT